MYFIYYNEYFLICKYPTTAKWEYFLICKYPTKAKWEYFLICKYPTKAKWEQTDKLWLNKVKIVDNINYCLVSSEP